MDINDGWCPFCAQQHRFPPDAINDPVYASIICPKCKSKILWSDTRRQHPPYDQEVGAHFRCPKCELVHGIDLVPDLFTGAYSEAYCPRCGTNLRDPSKPGKSVKGQPSAPIQLPSEKITPVTPSPESHKPPSSFYSRIVRHPQTYFSSQTFPDTFIKQNWDKGLRISDIVFANNMWLAVMSNAFLNLAQSYRSNALFPQQEINDFWKKGYSLTDIEYGSGQWKMIATQNCGYGQQKWFTRSYFPKEEIRSGWNDGYQITSLTFGDGIWAVVMSKGAPYTEQEWVTGNYDYVYKEIERCYKQGKHIIDLAFGAGIWAVVMAFNSGYSQQHWNGNSKFPKSQIQSDWNQGYSLSNVAFGDSTWMSVLSKP